MINKYILSIDQGTTGSRCFIFDAKARVVARAYQEFPQYFPKPGWVEHDANEIWSSVVVVIKKALAMAQRERPSFNSQQLAAIAITNQRETTLLWDRQNLKPSARAIVWQDRRTADCCAKLKAHEKKLKKITGLVLDPYFSATKIAWILDHTRGLRLKARQGQVAFGTIDSWLIARLTAGRVHATDRTNASRTLIYDIVKKQWSKPLLELFRVPENILPQVLPSAADFGHSAAVAGLPEGIPILAVMGDQQAALYGQGCFTPGTIKNTYGTGCFMVLNTGERLRLSNRGLLTTLACDIQGQSAYALEGSVFIAGAVIQWLRDQLKVIPDSAASQQVISGLKDNGGVYFVPAFVGLGAPYWNAQARGLITGLTRGSSAQHIIRAALESMAFQTKDIFDLMQKESGLKISRLAVDGGACRNDFLMQFQADILDIVVDRPAMIDSTVAGVAYLAGLRAGLWDEAQIRSLQKAHRRFIPHMSRAKAADLYRGWQKAVAQAQT